MNKQLPCPICRLTSWKIIVVFSILLIALTAYGALFDIATGIGMFYIYIISYFSAVFVVTPIVLVKRFGVGTLVYVPSVVLGLPAEYYMEWVRNQVLVSPWCVVGWCIFLLVIGFSADVAYNKLGFMEEKKRTILTGVIMGCVTFVLVLVAVSFFYVPASESVTYADVAYFGFPWLIVNSAFGGFTAYGISKDI